ncbi:MAG: hypothetical protein WDA09_03180 [Bacteriovoracaceae bacterium]
MKKMKEYFCACCRSPRKLRYQRNLKASHFVQIFILSAFVSMILFPWFGASSFFSTIFIWGLFEGTYKSLYRRDLVCPYCGFDPKWYKKDVKFARQKIEDFLKQNPDSPIVKRSQQLAEFEHLQ